MQSIARRTKKGQHEQSAATRCIVKPISRVQTPGRSRREFLGNVMRVTISCGVACPYPVSRLWLCGRDNIKGENCAGGLAELGASIGCLEGATRATVL